MNKVGQRTILLLGGTSETAPLAIKLAEAGACVLVSTATDAPLQVGHHPDISRRCGRLNLAQMVELIKESRFIALVDATHPYAIEVHQTARQACETTELPYFRYQRRDSQLNEESWLYAESHEQAAEIASADGRPVLLTVGSRNLLPYVEETKRQQVTMYARVLDHPESVRSCDAAGLESRFRIYGRGPFSYEDNLALIRKHQIGVFVTKESGQAGGVEEKWLAAQQEDCLFVVVKRPVEPTSQSFRCMDELLQVLNNQFTQNPF